MSLHHNPRIVTSGLVLALDAGDVNSYPGSGTTWYDLSGNNYSASLNNGAQKVGKGISFDGTNDYVNIPTSGDLAVTPTDSFSVEVFFKLITITEYPDNLYASNCTILGRGSTNGSHGIGAGKSTDGSLYIQAGSRAGDNLTISTSINSGEIYHALLTYTPFEQALYVNNSLIDTQDTSAGSSGTFDLSAWNCFGNGAVPGGNGQYPEGTLYQGRIYNRALSATEIEQNYLAQKSRFGL